MTDPFSPGFACLLTSVAPLYGKEGIPILGPCLVRQRADEHPYTEPSCSSAVAWAQNRSWRINRLSTRKKLSQQTIIQVLTESGYRCAVPTCRTILAIDLHHIVEVSEDGSDDPANLLALCPTCHALYHRGTISQESVYLWKGVLVALSRAFDVEALDDLLFLSTIQPNQLGVSGDGVLKFSRLIAASLATFHLLIQNGPLVMYEVRLTLKGQMLVDAWKAGNREAVANALKA
jgi:HNH endonuclease